MTTPTKPTIFISYSHRDEAWKNRLMPHLEVLSEHGLLTFWEDRQIGAGDDWYQKIEDAMNAASVAILLVSAHSLSGKFILREEVSRLLKRRDREGLLIIPVIVKACPWKKISWLSRMQVRPKDGKPLAAHGGNRLEEALSDIATEVYEQFKTVPGSSPQLKIARPDRRIYVEEADILEFSCDVLVLKYAQGFHGVDEIVARRLKGRSHDYQDISPKPGEFVLLPSKGQLAAKSVLFVGVADLYDFEYKQIREFAISSIRILSSELPVIQHVAMTMHGVGYGLDERESFLAQIGGIAEAFQTEAVPQFLERVTLVEKDQKRAERLKDLLKENLPSKFAGVTSRTKGSGVSKPAKEAGIKSDDKPYVFVVMSLAEGVEDVFIFGIQGPANRAGFLCERMDSSELNSDILTRIKSRIDKAAVVIADVSDASANTYLELGYAWGKDRPTLLLVRKGEDVKFDLPGQRSIIYKNISDLAKSIEKELVSERRRSS